jgi:DNA topoisomerase-1
MPQRKPTRHRQPEPPPTDPVAAAQVAGLRYVSDTTPGIRRKRAGKNFSFIGTDGQSIHDEEQLHRIKALAIPPAWTHVWICPDPNGHIQATGRDAKGRKQYRYHTRWREVRDETKYSRMIAFGQTLPKIRERIEHDIAQPGLSREKVLATVIRLLETTLIRVGNEEYAKTNKSFGLTTMRDRHVDISGSTVRFQFRGKSGKTHTISVSDRRLAKIVRRCRDIPGYDLFQYINEQGQRQDVKSEDVNAYLREITGEDFTAKDFRTWAGTVLASLALQEFEAFDSQTQAKKNIVRAIETVSERLGNTPSICRKCYVHPTVIDSYLEGTLLEALQGRIEQEIKESLHNLRPEEAAVLALLQQRLAREREASA